MNRADYRHNSCDSQAPASGPLSGVARLLIAVRIAGGLSQRELAERLGVHETQVSRDERNEYHGITVERANRILEALGVELRTVVERFPKAPHA